MVIALTDDDGHDEDDHDVYDYGRGGCCDDCEDLDGHGYVHCIDGDGLTATRQHGFRINHGCGCGDSPAAGSP